MGTGTVVVHIMDPAVETLLSDSNPFRRMSCTNERSECFSGTLRSRDDNRARLRMAASLPLTGLKYWKERTQNEIITPWKLTKMFQFWHSPPIVVLLKLTCLVCGIPKNDPYNPEQPIRPTIVKGRAYFQDTESSLRFVFRFTKKGPTDIVSLSKSFFIFSVYHWSKSTFFVSYPMYFWFLLLNEGWRQLVNKPKQY